MPNLSDFGVFLLAALVLAATPGPGIFYVIARTLAGGRTEGLSSSIGTGLGGMVHVIAGSIGVSAVVLASAELFHALKYLGAAYLIWMGMRTIMTARQDSETLLSQSERSSAGSLRALRDGVIVEALNPKTAIFFLAFIPQFVNPAAGNVAFQFFVLGASSILINTAGVILVTFAANKIREKAGKRPDMIRQMRQGSGGAMLALGVGLAFAKRPISLAP